MGEEIGLFFTFQEVRLRGETGFLAQVKVVEEGSGDDKVSDTYDFRNWEDMKRKYPTFKDFLAEVFNNANWYDYNGNDRTIYAEEVKGAEGLYDDEELTPENASINFSEIDNYGSKWEDEDEDEDEDEE